MKNVVYLKKLHYPCNNKSLADAARMEIVIDDCGKCSIQMEGTVLAQLLRAWRAQNRRYIAWREKQKNTVCKDLMWFS